MVFGTREGRGVTVSADIEVFGEFQGMYYLEHCKEKCERLELCGWIRRSPRGTLIGKLQGPKLGVDEMITWLAKKKSPGTRVDRCDVYNYLYISAPEFREFRLRF